jgi:hypothetical protein
MVYGHPSSRSALTILQRSILPPHTAMPPCSMVNTSVARGARAARADALPRAPLGYAVAQRHRGVRFGLIESETFEGLSLDPGWQCNFSKSLTNSITPFFVDPKISRANITISHDQIHRETFTAKRSHGLFTTSVGMVTFCNP